MSVEHSANELKHWAESLRDRVSRVSGRKKSTKEAGFNAELKVDLLDAIDLLLEHTDDEEPQPEAAPAWLQEVPALLSDQFQLWQANLAESLQQKISEPLEPLQNGFARELSSSLGEQLQAALAEQLSERLAQQIAESHNDSASQSAKDRAALQDELSESLSSSLSAVADQLDKQLSATLESSIAEAIQPLDSEPIVNAVRAGVLAELKNGDAGDRETAEIIQTLVDQQKQLNEKLLHYQDLLEQLQQDTNSALSSSTDKGLQELVRESQERTAAQDESFLALTNALREHGLVDPAFIKSLEDELGRAREELGELSDRNQSLNSTCKDLTQSLESREEDFRSLESKLEELQQENGQLLKDLSSHQEEMTKLRQDVAQAEELFVENESLEREVDRLKDELQNSVPQDRDGEIEELLGVAKREIEDLRNQNSDLAAQVAKQQVLQSNSAAQAQCDEENLSWEDRKRVIMQQFLEEDEEHTSPVRVEIEQVIASTDRELEKRDLHIAELQNRLDSSNATDANNTQVLIDQDDLVQQERARLQEIQKEWEEKLRQAEIDLSMERAKLARERTELESAKAEKELDDKPDKGRTRKWLDHLGLRDEKKSDSSENRG